MISPSEMRGIAPEELERRQVRQRRHMEYCLVSALKIGDVIREGKTWLQIRTVDPCSASRKGVPKYHINGLHCYDSIATVLAEVSSPVLAEVK